MSSVLKGKHIVLGISGGIAAYKTAYLLRLLIKQGAEVQVVMTPAAKEFITPVTMSSLSGKPVVSEFFTANTGEWHSHVDLGLWADLMVIVPATASTIAKMANGVADNMLITTYLSAKEHVMVAPAMDLDMWKHPSTQRNIRTLQQDGVTVISPASGELASHLVGKGRMEEPENIVEAIKDYFSGNDSRDTEELSDLSTDGGDHKSKLVGKRVVITAGPTFENIDPVRFIGNYSSGKMGFALAKACVSAGADVTLISGPVELPTPEDVKRINVRRALDMHAEALKLSDDADIMIFAAAVADYRPEDELEFKLKREQTEEMILKLVKNPDIAADCGKNKKTGQIMVGFALETDSGLEQARQKMKRKNLDMIVLNSLTDKGAGFGTDTNKITVITPRDEKSFSLKSKDEVAFDIIAEIERLKTS